MFGLACGLDCLLWGLVVGDLWIGILACWIWLFICVVGFVALWWWFSVV